MKLAIIGAGDMGRWFTKLFCNNSDWEVMIADQDESKAKKVSVETGGKVVEGNKEAVKQADIVLVAVPIEVTPGVIKEIASHLKEDALLLDIASVKEKIVDTMKDLDVNSELASIHPLFGPGAGDLNGKNVISIPIRGGDKYQKFKKNLSDLGAQVIEMEAVEHDQMMSITQSLTHFILLTYLSAINSMEGSPETEPLQTPMFRKLFELSKAFLKENPEVCADIQVENKYSQKARSTVLESCRKLDSALQAKDIEMISEVFEEARDEFDSEEIEKAYQNIYEKEEEE